MIGFLWMDNPLLHIRASQVARRKTDAKSDHMRSFVLARGHRDGRYATVRGQPNGLTHFSLIFSLLLTGAQFKTLQNKET
jgi:hypothetical protein